MGKRKTEFETDVTLHLIRIGSDVEHIKEDITSINTHLSAINGRVRENEKQISWMKGIGATVTFLVATILAWLGISE